MVELVDTGDLKSLASNGVRVRVPPRAPITYVIVGITKKVCLGGYLAGNRVTAAIGLCAAIDFGESKDRHPPAKSRKNLAGGAWISNEESPPSGDNRSRQFTEAWGGGLCFTPSFD